MTTITPLTPCRGQHQVFDVVLHASKDTPQKERLDARAQAAELCAACPAPCAWLIRPPQPARRRHPEPCGTGAAYRRHERLGEDIDTACAKATEGA